MARLASLALRAALFVVLLVVLFRFFMCVPGIADWIRSLMGKNPGDPVLAVAVVSASLIAGLIAFHRDP